MKKQMKQRASWLLAFILALLICNTLLFLYNRPSGWIERTNSSTLAIWNPGTSVLMGTEGRGFYNVDSKGFLNSDLPLKDDYFLAVGASYTQGKEVKNGLRYTDLLNNKLQDSPKQLAVYNCSQDAYYLPDIINGFYAITKEFDGATAIVIEIGTTDFSEDSLLNSINQRGFDESQLGKNIMATLSNRKKLILELKEKLPIWTIFKTQAQNIQALKSTMTIPQEDYHLGHSNYKSILNEALALIRSEYDGQLIILYHPSVSINHDGTISIIDEDTTEVFLEVCENNNITFLDMSDAFEEEYKENYGVPYGFDNTTIGSGHLNETGHRVIANELYKELKGGEEE